MVSGWLLACMWFVVWNGGAVHAGESVGSHVLQYSATSWCEPAWLRCGLQLMGTGHELDLADLAGSDGSWHSAMRVPASRSPLLLSQIGSRYHSILPHGGVCWITSG